MRKIDRLHKKITNFLYDHIALGAFLKLAVELIISVAAGVLFAFGFSCFISNDSATLVTGGASGLCQNIVIIAKMCGASISSDNLQSILYFAINIPILIFAFLKIGKKFALLSVVVVGCSSIFISVFTDTGVARTIQDVTFIQNSPLTRALFAGLCSGVSSSIAFKIDSSSGGVDVATYYMGMKKSSQIGKYGVIINSIVVVFYFILLVIGNPHKWGENLVIVLYSIVYLFIVSLVIDLINIRNKKAELSITTDQENMASTLVSLFPHGATVSNVKGAYSEKEKQTVYMVVSSTEVHRVIRVAKQVDSNAFIVVTPVNKLVGNFFSRPVE